MRMAGVETERSVGKPMGFLRNSKSDSILWTRKPSSESCLQDSRAALLSYKDLDLLFDRSIKTGSVFRGITAKAAVESAPPLKAKQCLPESDLFFDCIPVP